MPSKTHATCLGSTPLYVANEGTFVAFVEQNDVSKALEILKKFRADAQAIGVDEVGEGVIANSAFGSKRVLDMLSGEQLPRIC
jgi:hydrogenase expression/formation protein HypE